MTIDQMVMCDDMQPHGGSSLSPGFILNTLNVLGTDSDFVVNYVVRGSTSHVHLTVHKQGDHMGLSTPSFNFNVSHPNFRSRKTPTDVVISAHDTQIMLYNSMIMMKMAFCSDPYTLIQMCKDSMNFKDAEVSCHQNSPIYDFIESIMHAKHGSVETITHISLVYHAWSVRLATTFLSENMEFCNLRLLWGMPPRALYGTPNSVSMRGGGNGMPFNVSISDVIDLSQPAGDGSYEAFLYCVGLKKMAGTGIDVRLAVDSASAVMFKKARHEAYGYDTVLLNNPSNIPVFPVARVVVRK